MRRCYTCKKIKSIADDFYRKKYQCKKCQQNYNAYCRKIKRLIKKKTIVSKENPWLKILLRKIKQDIKQRKKELKAKGLIECKNCGKMERNHHPWRRTYWLCIECTKKHRKKYYKYERMSASDIETKKAKTLERRRECHRTCPRRKKREKEYQQNVHDRYIKKLLRRSGVENENITTGMIGLKRELVLSYRLIKELESGINSNRNQGAEANG